MSNPFALIIPDKGYRRFETIQVAEVSRERNKTLWIKERFGERRYLIRDIWYRVYATRAEAEAAIPEAIRDAMVERDRAQERWCAARASLETALKAAIAEGGWEGGAGGGA